MPIRTTIRALGRFVFQQQQLALPLNERDPLGVVRRTGPLRADRSTHLHMALWARMARYSPDDLYRALYRRRSLVRIQALRSRLYVVPAESVAAYHALAGPVLGQGIEHVEHLLSQARGEQSRLVSEADARHVAQRVLEVLGAHGPLTIEELMPLLPELSERIPHDPKRPDLGYSLLGTRLIPAMCAEGMLVRAETRGEWRSDLYSYAPLAIWLPHVKLDAVSRRDALSAVLRAYVLAYGPVTVADAQHWLGNVSRRDICCALMRLDGVTHVHVDGCARDHVMLDSQVELLEKVADDSGKVALLPPHDALLSAYADTARFLDPRDEPRVFDHVGDAHGTVWLDGRVVGVWVPHVREERIQVRLFLDRGPEVFAAIGERARKLAGFFGFGSPELDIGSYDRNGEAQREAMSVVVGDLA